MYLGIDLGTSSVKVVVIDEESAIVGSASSSLDVKRLHPLWSEQDPKEWWSALCIAIDELNKKYPCLISQIRCIGLSGQMHGATLLDEAHGILRPAILWNDGRSFAECIEIEKNEPKAQEITGNLIMPGFTAPKLLWVAKNEPEIFKKIAHVLLPKDYIRLLMSGDLATDMSDAAGTAWLNTAKRCWSPAMLQTCRLSEKQMPRLFEGTEITGTLSSAVAQLWGMSPNTPIAAGGGDNAATAISVNVTQSKNAFLSLGTSGVYFVCSDRYLSNPAGGVHTFCHCIPGLWHHMTVHLSAASCLPWLQNLIHQPSVAEMLAIAEKSPQKKENVVFLPYLCGERTPHNDPHAQGVFFGLNLETNSSDLTQAVLEGVALAFNDGQQEMLNAGIEIGDLYLVGGGARSDYWAQIIADILQHPLLLCNDREIGAALGAARLAYLAHSGTDPKSAFPPPTVEKKITPTANASLLYNKKKELYKQLYPKLKPLFT